MDRVNLNLNQTVTPRRRPRWHLGCPPSAHTNSTSFANVGALNCLHAHTTSVVFALTFHPQLLLPPSVTQAIAQTIAPLSTRPILHQMGHFKMPQTPQIAPIMPQIAPIMPKIAHSPQPMQAQCQTQWQTQCQTRRLQSSSGRRRSTWRVWMQSVDPIWAQRSCTTDRRCIWCRT